MALRPGRCFRRIERPYTRISYSVKSKNYIPGAPQPKIRIFEMGNKNGNFDVALYLVSKSNVQVRDNALEAVRVAVNKELESEIGKENYFFKILKYPHHVLREHPIAMGAGADRYSQGMRLAFGRPVGRAVQLFEGEKLLMIKTKKQYIEIAKNVLRIANCKLPCKSKIVVEELKG